MIDAKTLLWELVSIDSVSRHEHELAEHLTARMNELGFDAHVDEAGNAVGVRGGGDGRRIVLLGHMDTVPGDVPKRIEGDLLYGRGSVDAKGPLATFVLAAAQAEIPDDATLVVIGAVEEEIHTSKGARHAAHLPAPDACIIGEPSGWDAVTLGYKGCLRLDYELVQDCGHGAGPHRAVAEHAAEFWQHVERIATEHNDGRERLFDQLMPSLQSIRTSSDGLQDRVEAVLGFRLPLDFDADAFLGTLRELAGAATLRDYGHEPAWRIARTDPLAREFGRAFTRRNLKPRFKNKTGTSDMNILGPAWGCPIVAYGPGDSLLDHTPNEHVSISEVERAVLVLREVLEARLTTS